MKKLLILFLTGLIGLTGCTSWWKEVLTDEQKLQAICNTTQGVAQTTVSLVVAKNPDLKEWFLLSSNIIQVSVNNGTVKPTEIMAEIDKALTGAVLNEEVKAGVEASINTILTLYSTVYTINIEGNMNEYAKAYVKILRSACVGIDIACGKVASSSVTCKKYKPVEDYLIAELKFSK